VTDAPPGTAGPPLDITIVEFLPSGGMFQFAFQLADALARAGHRVRLLTGPNPELTATTPGLSVISMLPTWHPNAPQSGGKLCRKARRAWRALLLSEAWRRVVAEVHRSRPDIIQFGELRFPLDAAGLLAVSRLTRSPVVDVAHNPLPYDVNDPTRPVEKAAGYAHRLLGRAYAACALVLVLGDGPRSLLLKTFPHLRAVAVCGHGDYSGLLAPDPVPAPSAAPPSALLFGAWTRYKNIPLLLESFALVRRKLPAARLTLAGPVMPDVDLGEVEARASAIGGVDLRPGYVEMADLPALFGAHRLVAFTYATVNISGSVHMAYTFGRPVVATRVGAMADVVRHGETGVLADPTPGDIAQALLELLEDPVKADRMGAAAADYSRAASSWDQVAGRVSAAYREFSAPRT